jgi:hypothetical protein
MVWTGVAVAATGAGLAEIAVRRPILGAEAEPAS